MENVPEKIGINKKVLAVRAGGGLLIVGGLGLALPLLVNAFLGGMALLGAGVVLGVLVVANIFVPLVMQKAENIVLGMRKDEAVRRPIEQLQSSYLKGLEISAKKQRELESFLTEIDTMQDDLDKSKKEFPDQDWSDSEQYIVASRAEHAEELEKLAALQESLVDTEKQIKVWERRLKMSESRQRVESAGGTAREIAIDAILKEAAENEVAKRLNSTMSAMTVKTGLKEQRAAIRKEKAGKLSDGAM